MIWHILSLGTELAVFELVEKLFQGQLVLRTRCLECECFTERREDFQDISVPVQEDELSKSEESSESKYQKGGLVFLLQMAVEGGQCRVYQGTLLLFVLVNTRGCSVISCPD